MFFIQAKHSITICYCFYTISFMLFSTYINHIYIVYSTEAWWLFVSFFILLCFHNTETNSLWLIYESINAVNITTLVVSNLVFPINTILSYSFFLIIDFYFFVPAVIAQVFNLFTELVIPIGIPTNEAKVQIETQSITAEMRKKNARSNLNCYMPYRSLCFTSSKK